MPIDGPTLTAWDWLTLGLYAALLVVSGYLLSRRAPKTGTDYFLAGRSMPAWAVAVSILATSLSAATFVGGPEQAFRGDLTYLSATIGGIIGAIGVAVIFIPRYYRHEVTTVYELLDVRFGPAARSVASGMFMIGRVMASGARIYIGALPAALILYGDVEPQHIAVAVGVMTVVGVGYTLVGGVRSVIWSDVIQTVVFVGAAVAALILLYQRLPLGFGEIIDVLRTAGPDGSSKLTVIDPGIDLDQPRLGFDPGATYTLITACIGFALFNLAAYGTDQDLAQRMLTCKSSVRGSASVIAAILVGLPVTLLFMTIGLLLFIFYRRPDLMGDAAPTYATDDTRKIFLDFILREMPPGLAGLMLAGLFAAGLSSLNSALNAMASALVGDWYRRWRTDRSERHYVQVGRIAVVGWGVVLGAFAIFAALWHGASGSSLIDFALAVMTFAYSGLVAVFLVATLTKRGNSASAIAAMAVGAAVILVFQPPVWSRVVPDEWALRIAFPWQMTVATTLAFITCVIGRPAPGKGSP